MDILSVIGLVLGFSSVIATTLMDGGTIGSIIQGPAFVIVGGGTLGAVLLQTRLQIFFRGVQMLSWVVFPPRDNAQELLDKIMEWVRLSRRESILVLDRVAEEQTDPLVRQGLRLVVDGVEAHQLRAILETMIYTQEHHELLACEIFEAMGGYAPTVGILGAVMGLITVMSHLDDPSKLGAGIATAFVATVYGVGFANLIFLPISNKLRVLVRGRVRRMDMIVEGMVGMSVMEKPIQLEMRLRGYLSEEADHSRSDEEREGDEEVLRPGSGGDEALQG